MIASVESRSISIGAIDSLAAAFKDTCRNEEDSSGDDKGSCSGKSMTWSTDETVEETCTSGTEEDGNVEIEEVHDEEEKLAGDDAIADVCATE